MVDDSVEAAVLEAVGKLGQLQCGQHVQEAGLGVSEAAASDEDDGEQKREQLHRPGSRRDWRNKLFNFVFFLSLSRPKAAQTTWPRVADVGAVT